MDVIGVEILGLGGYGVTSKKIANIVSSYQSQVVYDEINESARATVTIDEGQINPIINGRTVTPGTYVFWYDNERSLTAKLQLINKYNLKGSGCWSLGQELEETWIFYNKAANGDNSSIEIDDVPKTHWAYDAICWAKESGLIEGRSEKLFEPEGTLTRAEFATLICRKYNYNYLIEGDFYLDIKNHWARNNVNAVTIAKLMNGYNNGLFYPDKEITREEVAKVLYYLVNKENRQLKFIDFSDVSSDRWSYEYIKELSALGIINGYENGEFRPTNPIKRSEIVTMLHRIFD